MPANHADEPRRCTASSTLSVSSCRTICAAARADRGADGDFALPAGRAREQQVGDVRARDQQHEADRAEQDAAGPACTSRTAMSSIGSTPTCSLSFIHFGFARRNCSPSTFISAARRLASSRPASGAPPTDRKCPWFVLFGSACSGMNTSAGGSARKRSDSTPTTV